MPGNTFSFVRANGFDPMLKFVGAGTCDSGLILNKVLPAKFVRCGVGYKWCVKLIWCPVGVKLA